MNAARPRSRGPWARAAVPIALGLAVLSAFPAARRMARLYQQLRPELDELLPPDSPAVRGAHTLRARASGSQYLGVVIRGATAGPPAALAAALGTRMSAFAAVRPDLIAAVKTDVAAERAFLTRRGALYLPLDDLRTIADRLSARVSWEKARANPLFVSLDEEGGPPSVDFSDIDARARASDPFAGRFADDRLVSADGRMAIVLIFLATAEAGAGELAPIVERARSAVAALRGMEGAAALEVGYAGDVAIAVEELSALESDVAVSALLVLIGVVLSILLAFRAPRTLPALALPLAIGTAWGFGVASLFVSSLGSSTAFLGSIVIGNGINPGIILLARYLEERRRCTSAAKAAAVATRTTWRGTLAAAVAAAAGYASLAMTSFRGFNEFGVIASAGALTCWLATYLFLPRLLRLVDRAPPSTVAGAPAPAPAAAPADRLATALVSRGAGRVVTVSLVLIGAAALLATRLDSRRIEYDMSKLRNRESRRSGEGYWGAQMDAFLGRNFTAVAFMTETPAQARTVGAALARAVKNDPLASVSSRLVTPDDLIPPDDGDKRAELARIARLLTPGVKAALSDDDRASLDKLLGAAGDGPITPAELPVLLARGMREKDGRFGRTLLMLQSLDNATWDGAVTIRAAAAVHEVAKAVSPPAAVAGGFVVSANILETLEREALPTTAAACGAVALVVLVLFRGRRETFWTLGALLGGTTLLAGAVVALDIRINFLSFIAFPITFGIGVEYALNVLYRHRQDPEQLAAVVSGTGRAVALCSLTTIIGYGSLLLARNQALFSFGMLAVLGEICCLAVAVVALPAALAVARRRG